MRLGLALLVSSIGSIVAACTSDLKLSLENKQCDDDERCVSPYLCDTNRNLCVLDGLDDGGGISPPSPGLGGAGGAMGGTGAGQGGVAGDAGGGGDAGSAQGGAGGAASDPDAGFYDPVDGGDACVPALVYRDRDNDGFGDEDTSRTACPGNGWVLDGTDCRDDIADVNPGQTQFFRTSYLTPTGPSFDHDCSGAEEPAPDNDTNDPAPDCGGLGGLGGNCVGSGFLPASDPPRTGPGVVDQRCGSTLRRNCQFNGLLSQCESVDTPLDDELTFRCR